MKTDIEKVITEIKDKKLKAIESVKYSTDRIDIVVISLSTGAIALTINIISNLKECELTNLIWFLKLSLLSFVVSIILNLLSQLSSFYHFKLKVERFDIQIENLRKTSEKDDEKSNTYKTKMFYYNKITNILNYLSTYLLIIGIILLSLFFIIKY